LGNIAPDVASEDVEMGSPDPPSSPALTDAEAQQKLKVDSSKPLTTIQVRLSTGGRVIVKLNTTNTISDLRRYIRLVRPDAPVNFSLLTTFPNKELTDDTITLKDADVLGAAILMRAT
jgi:UBX domain-containing protein 1